MNLEKRLSVVYRKKLLAQAKGVPYKKSEEDPPLAEFGGREYPRATRNLLRRTRFGWYGGKIDTEGGRLGNPSYQEENTKTKTSF